MGFQNYEVCPLNLSFFLGMSSEVRLVEKSLPADKGHGTAEDHLTESREENAALRPSSNMSSSSGNTEKSLSAYAENLFRDGCK